MATLQMHDRTCDGCMAWCVVYIYTTMTIFIIMKEIPLYLKIILYVYAIVMVFTIQDNIR